MFLKPINFRKGSKIIFTVILSMVSVILGNAFSGFGVKNLEKF